MGWRKKNTTVLEKMCNGANIPTDSREYPPGSQYRSKSVCLCMMNNYKSLDFDINEKNVLFMGFLFT